MSIGAKPWEGGGASSVPDASETTKGKIRIATSTEAGAGTDDLTAMTPLTVKERIDAALVGGVEYKGTFNATAGTPSLATAEKGDLYIVGTAGTIYGQTWAVGDHLLINANMGGSIDNSKIDKVDNTDAVTSVNTQTGAVVLSANDLAADYTPTSYIPSNTNIDGHLEGIDDEFLLTAPLASPALTGTPTAPTATSGTNTTQIATTAFVTTAVAGAGGISSVVEDTTPQLGGDLDVNGQTITSASNADVTLDPNGTGDVVLGADLMPDADATHYIGDENTRFISAYTDINGAIRFKAKNDQGASISKGQAVYIKGVSGTVPTVGLARANSASTMPAFGLALTNANDQAEVQVISFGNLTDYNTSTYSLSAGDTVFVSAATAGALTSSAPAGESNLIQNIGRVVRADASAGIIKVGGAGRSNATPNLDQNKIFVGNASNQAVSTALSAINLSSFNNDLSATNQINALQIKTGSSYTAQANYIYIGSYTSGTQTVTMPAASGATSGDIIGFTSNVASRALSLVSSDGSTNDIINQSNQAKGGSSGALSLTVNQQISWFIHNGSKWYEANAALSAVTTSGAYSDLSGTPTLGTAAAADTGDFLASTAGLNDLSDVSFTAGAGIDNYILTYDNATTSWGAEAAPTAAAASETQAGVIEIATNTEAQAASATDKALVPSNIGSIDTGDLNDDGTYLKNLSEDSTPQLGGDLDLNGSDIVTTSNADLDLAPNGTGVVVIRGNDNSGALKLNCENNSHGVTIQGPPHSASATYTLTLPNNDGDADQVLKTDGSGALSWVDQGSSPPNVTTDSSGTNTTISTTTGIEEIHLINNTTNNVTITIPTAATAGAGYKYQVKRLGTGTCSVAPSSGTIDGASSFSLASQYDAITLVSDGSNYHII